LNEYPNTEVSTEIKDCLIQHTFFFKFFFKKVKRSKKRSALETTQYPCSSPSTVALDRPSSTPIYKGALLNDTRAKSSTCGRIEKINTYCNELSDDSIAKAEDIKVIRIIAYKTRTSGITT